MEQTVASALRLEAIGRNRPSSSSNDVLGQVVRPPQVTIITTTSNAFTVTIQKQLESVTAPNVPMDASSTEVQSLTV